MPSASYWKASRPSATRSSLRSGPLTAITGPTAQEDWIEEIVPLAGRDLLLHRPRDTNAMLIEEAFDHEELLPYWAELWPSGVALADDVLARSWRGARVLELGCGLGLVSIAAALSGARVLATDWSKLSVAATQANARRNGARLDTAVVDWSVPEGLLSGAPWDAVLAADVLYEERNVGLLLDLLPRLTREVWLGDPGRPGAVKFRAAATRDWTVTQRGMVTRMRKSTQKPAPVTY